MIHKIVATVLFVRDLAKCTAFYQDTLGLQFKGSDPDSAVFLLEDRYLILLSVSVAAYLLSSQANALLIEEALKGFWPLMLRMSMPTTRRYRPGESRF